MFTFTFALIAGLLAALAVDAWGLWALAATTPIAILLGMSAAKLTLMERAREIR